MKRAILLLIITLALMSCNRQGKKGESFNSISISDSDTIMQYAIEQKDSVLLCIDYAEAPSFSAMDESYIDYTRRVKNYYKGKKSLTKQFIKRHLLLDADSVFIQNIWSGDTVDKVSLDYFVAMNNFYVTDTVLNTPFFIGIVYEMINGDGSEKHLYTFDKSGTFISKVSIAFYQHSGSYTDDDGSRLPWFAKKTGCINSNLIVTTISEDATKQFKILPNGKIVALK